MVSATKVAIIDHYYPHLRSTPNICQDYIEAHSKHSQTIKMELVANFLLRAINSFCKETIQKTKFSIKGFLSKCDHFCNFLWIWSHLLKKSLMETFIFFEMKIPCCYECTSVMLQLETKNCERFYQGIHNFMKYVCKRS